MIGSQRERQHEFALPLHELTAHFAGHPGARDSTYDLLACLIRGTIVTTFAPTSP
ncbi:hypothetical protein BH11PSE10_BH11PSE10_02250 [soil metagenome]